MIRGGIFLFYTPVFRRDVLWYGDVCPSVRPGLRPSVRPGLRPPVFHTFLLHALTYWAGILHMTLFYCTTDQVWVSSISVKFCASYAPFVTYNTGNTQFSALFSNMLRHIELKLCIRLCFTVLQIKFECRQFASIFVGVMPLLELTILEIQFSALFSYMLWHIELKFCTWLCYTVLPIKYECCQFASIFVGVMPLLELRILQIHSFPNFSPTCFDILSWNFAYDFVLLYYRSSSSVVNFRQVLCELCPFCNILEIHSFPHFSLTCFDMFSWNFAHDFVILYYRSSLSVVNLHQFLLELCPFWNLEYWKYTVFFTFLLHALTNWAEILHMTLFYWNTDQVQVSSICVNICGSYAPFGT